MTALNRLNSGSRGCCSVDSDAVAPTYRRSRGFSGAIVRNGVGDYSLTLTEGIDILNGDLIINATVFGPGLHAIAVELVSSTVLRVRTSTLTAVPTIAAADLDFTLEIKEIGPN